MKVTQSISIGGKNYGKVEHIASSSLSSKFEAQWEFRKKNPDTPFPEHLKLNREEQEELTKAWLEATAEPE